MPIGRWRTFLFSRLLPALLLANMATLVWGALSNRPLFADGAYFLFNMLDNQRPSWGLNFLRFFSAVLQLPSLLVLWLRPHEKSTELPTLLYCLSLSLHPALSLLACHRLLRSWGKSEYFLFPALSFALCTQALMAYPSLVIPETLSLYWPYLLLLLFRRGETAWELPALVLGTLCLMFTYEVALLFFLLDIVFLLVLRKGACTRRSDQFLALLSALGLLFMLWRLFGPHAGTKEQFLYALEEATYREPFRLTGFLFLGATGTALCLHRFFPHRDRSIALFVAIAVAAAGGRFVLLLLRLPVTDFIVEIWLGRTTVIPVSCVLVCLLAFSHYFDVFPLLRHSYTYVALGLLACAVLGLTAARDLLLTKSWRAGYAVIEELRRENPGCNVIASEVATRLLHDHFLIDNFWLPMLTLAPEKSYEPESIFVVERVAAGGACGSEAMLTASEPAAIHLNRKLSRFRVGRFLDLPIRVHLQDPLRARRGITASAVQPGTRKAGGH